MLHPAPGLVFHLADIADQRSISTVWDQCGPFDAVVNLAARAGVRQSVANPGVYVETNVTGTLNLLELCRRDGVGKFVLASTSSLYGGANPVPFSEDADTSRPLSPYAASKKGAEALCFTYHHLYGLDVTVFRYFTVYGPAGRPDMSLLRFVQWVSEGRPLRLYGDGSQSRAFTYVDDVARGTILGLKPLGFEVINLGGDSPHDLMELIALVERETGEKYVRMEMGVPGLPPNPIAVEAQIDALKRGVAAIYPDIQGIPPVKRAIARFVKQFLGVTVDPDHCLPTVGSMMGAMACFLTINRMYANREGTLFIDPGFPVQKQQCRVLGHGYMSFDVYDYRGPKLADKLRAFLDTGKVSSILYSNPNNPSWICFTEDELATIGRLADEYDVIVIEDLAYFGMDFRKDYSRPGVPPFQPSVARYTDRFILLISSSKVFSYAGERIGMLVVSDAVWNMRAPDLKRYYTSDQVGYALVFGAIYSLSSGTSHSAQYALAAVLEAVNDGKLNYVESVRDYGEKARVMKRIFTEHGFRIVYDRDLDEPIADGFYFTFSYPGLTGEQLLRELVYYGVSAIALGTTGSERTEGLRACTSLISRDQFPVLESRLARFAQDHPHP
jgi:nucleoside-diphosphate-sugar epimerase